MVILQDIPSIPFLFEPLHVFSTKLNSFTHEVVNIISVVLCLVRHSVFANTLHPAKRCSIPFVGHSLHLLHSSLLEGSHAFVSTICSSIVITMTVFLGVRFCLSHKLQLSSCFRNISLCIFFLQVSFFPFPLTSFFNLAFSPCWFTVFFNSFSIQ